MADGLPNQAGTSSQAGQMKPVELDGKAVLFVRVNLQVRSDALR